MPIVSIYRRIKLRTLFSPFCFLRGVGQDFADRCHLLRTMSFQRKRLSLFPCLFVLLSALIYHVCTFCGSYFSFSKQFPKLRAKQSEAKRKLHCLLRPIRRHLPSSSYTTLDGLHDSALDGVIFVS